MKFSILRVVFIYIIGALLSSAIGFTTLNFFLAFLIGIGGSAIVHEIWMLKIMKNVTEGETPTDERLKECF